MGVHAVILSFIGFSMHILSPIELMVVHVEAGIHTVVFSSPSRQPGKYAR